MTERENIAAIVLAYVLWLAALPLHPWLGGERTPVAWLGVLGTCLVVAVAMWGHARVLGPGLGRAKSLAWGAGFGSCVYVFPLVAFVLRWMGPPAPNPLMEEMGPYTALLTQACAVGALVGMGTPPIVGVCAGVLGGLRSGDARPAVGPAPRRTFGVAAVTVLLPSAWAVSTVFHEITTPLAENAANELAWKMMPTASGSLAVLLLCTGLAVLGLIGWAVYELTVAWVAWAIHRGVRGANALSSVTWGLHVGLLGYWSLAWWLGGRLMGDAWLSFGSYALFAVPLLVLLGMAAWRAREAVHSGNTFRAAGAVSQAGASVAAHASYWVPVLGFALAYTGLDAMTDSLDRGVRDPVLRTLASSQLLFDHIMPYALRAGRLVFVFWQPLLGLPVLAVAWASNRWLSASPATTQPKPRPHG